MARIGGEKKSGDPGPTGVTTIPSTCWLVTSLRLLYA